MLPYKLSCIIQTLSEDGQIGTVSTETSATPQHNAG